MKEAFCYDLKYCTTVEHRAHYSVTAEERYLSVGYKMEVIGSMEVSFFTVYSGSSRA